MEEYNSSQSDYDLNELRGQQHPACQVPCQEAKA